MLSRIILISALFVAGCNPMEARRGQLAKEKMAYLHEETKGPHKVYIHSKLEEGLPSIMVSLSRFTEDADYDGNVFIGKVSDTTRTLTLADLQTQWLSEDSLLIRHSSELEVVKREQLVGNVHIVYDTPRKEED